MVISETGHAFSHAASVFIHKQIYKNDEPLQRYITESRHQDASGRARTFAIVSTVDIAPAPRPASHPI